MDNRYVHGYDQRENIRLQDQASTLVDLLHSDTLFPAGSKVLEAGCGVGAQTITLAKNSPEAHITSIDISEASVAEAKKRIEAKGFSNVKSIFKNNPEEMQISAGNFFPFSAVRALISFGYLHAWSMWTQVGRN